MYKYFYINGIYGFIFTSTSEYLWLTKATNNSKLKQKLQLHQWSVISVTSDLILICFPPLSLTHSCHIIISIEKTHAIYSHKCNERKWSESYFPLNMPKLKAESVRTCCTITNTDYWVFWFLNEKSFYFWTNTAVLTQLSTDNRREYFSFN